MAAQDVENRPFVAFVGRAIRAAGRRAGAGDPTDLADLVRLRRELNEAIDQAANELHDAGGYSWAEIGRELGLSKQRVHAKYGRPVIEPAAPAAPLVDGSVDRAGAPVAGQSRSALVN